MNRKEAEFEQKDLVKKINALKETVSSSQKLLSQHERRLVEITNYLANQGSDQPTVSDHAVLRYMERHYNFDVSKIRNEILTPERESAIKAGATSFQSGGLSFVVKNNVVITAKDK